MPPDIIQHIDTQENEASWNMRFDEELLDTLDPGAPPLFHFYRWKSPSFTFGYFIQPHLFFSLLELEKRGIEIARRPTGGGIVCHMTDLAFSFLMPSQHPAFSLNPLENYRFVNEFVVRAIASLFPDTEEIELSLTQENSSKWASFCMAHPTHYDVMWKGRKVAGAAQRKKKQGYLHQGTISLMSPDRSLLEALLLPREGLLEAMDNRSFAPIQNKIELEGVREALKKRLKEEGRKQLELSLS